MISKTLIFLASFLTGGMPASPDPAPVAAKPAAAVEHKQTHNPAPVAAKPAAAVEHKQTHTRVAARLGAGEVVAKVQNFYTDTKQLTALFRQTYTNATFGKQSVSDGKVWIKKPGKMRWDYMGKNKAVKKSFISDGSMLWAVEHDNKQVFKKDLKQNMLPVAITFLYGEGDLQRDFEPRLDTSGTHGAKSDYVLELTPRKPSAQYKKLYLVVDPQDFRVKQSIVIEASGNTNHFRFFSPNTKKQVKDSWFVFNEKAFKSYRMVEGDEAQKM